MTPANFRAIRNALGLTQGALALRLGVGRRIVQYWESGERTIPETVARIMRVSIDDPAFLDRLAAA